VIISEGEGWFVECSRLDYSASNSLHNVTVCKANKWIFFYYCWIW